MNIKNSRSKDTIVSSPHIIWILLWLMPLMGFALDAYTPSLTIINNYLGSSTSIAKLTISLFILGFGVGQLFIGPLSDIFGRRKILISSLFIYCVFNMLSTFSHSMMELIAYRIIQGVASAGIILSVRVIAVDCFNREMLRKVSISISTTWALSPVIGPFIGGYLQYYFGWKSVFYFLTLYSLIMLFIVYFFLKESHKHREKIYFKNILDNYIHVSKNVLFLRNVLGLSFSFSMINLFNIQGPFIIQDIFMKSPLFYSHIALLVGITGFCGSLLNRALMRSLTLDKIISRGILFLVIFSFIFILLSKITYNGEIILVIVAVSFISFFCLILYPIFSTNCSNMFKNMAGTAAAYRGVLSMFIASVITSIFSLIKVTDIHYLLYSYLFLSLLTAAAMFMGKSKRMLH